MRFQGAYIAAGFLFALPGRAHIVQYGSRRSNPYLGGIETPICHTADGGFGVAEAVLTAKKTPPALPGVFAYALRP